MYVFIIFTRYILLRKKLHKLLNLWIIFIVNQMSSFSIIDLSLDKGFLFLFPILETERRAQRWGYSYCQERM